LYFLHKQRIYEKTLRAALPLARRTDTQKPNETPKTEKNEKDEGQISPTQEDGQKELIRIVHKS
jgi:hypothetical protein